MPLRIRVITLLHRDHIVRRRIPLLARRVQLRHIFVGGQRAQIIQRHIHTIRLFHPLLKLFHDSVARLIIPTRDRHAAFLLNLIRNLGARQPPIQNRNEQIRRRRRGRRTRRRWRNTGSWSNGRSWSNGWSRRFSAAARDEENQRDGGDNKQCEASTHEKEPLTKGEHHYTTRNLLKEQTVET